MRLEYLNSQRHAFVCHSSVIGHREDEDVTEPLATAKKKKDMHTALLSNEF
jgi:hypothetical protein